MKKLNLEKLKVKSFVTEVNALGKKTVHGGGSANVVFCKYTTDQVWSMQPLQSICSPCITPHTNIQRCVTIDTADNINMTDLLNC